MESLDRVAVIAREAGDVIMEIYARDDHGATLKADDSPLTLADRAAHECIVAGLTALTPEIPILSEEAESAAYAVRSRWQRYWVVDPLDGTKEFLKRNGEFTVNIALIEGGRPVAGVVHAPALGTTYTASTEGGAWRTDASGTQRIHVSDYRTDGLRVVASRSHAGELMPRFLEAMDDPPCVSKGSSLKFCLVAEGTANLYPRFGPTMEWDVAAAHAVVDAAGGTITDLEGRPLEYNKPDLHNPHFVVCGAPPYPWQAVLAGLSPAAP
jgi:3'(2'), 5'-bisphosphate nucleotidase